MRGGLGNIMKQAQAMQENMKKAQEELAEIEVEGQSGGGLVSIIMSCKHDVRRVTIAPELVDDEVDVLEDLIAAAFNDALNKVERTTQDKMGGLTEGMNLPGGLKMPF